MAPDHDQMPRHAACPACGAALRPGSPWCTLCYADLRAPEERPAADPPAPPAPVGDPLTQPLIDFLPTSVLPPAPRTPESAESMHPPTSPLDDPAPAAVPTWPCSTCGVANPIEATSCVACGAAFLATVAHESRTALVLPVVGDITRLSRSQRLVGAAAFVVLLVLFVAVITLLLSKRPPELGGPSTPPSEQPAVIEPNTIPATIPPTIPTVAPTGFPVPGAPTAVPTP